MGEVKETDNFSKKESIELKAEMFTQGLRTVVGLMVNGVSNSDQTPFNKGISLNELLNLSPELTNQFLNLKLEIDRLPVPVQKPQTLVASLGLPNEKFDIYYTNPRARFQLIDEHISKISYGIVSYGIPKEADSLNRLALFNEAGICTYTLNILREANSDYDIFTYGMRLYGMRNNSEGYTQKMNLLKYGNINSDLDLEILTHNSFQNLIQFFDAELVDPEANIRKYAVNISISDIEEEYVKYRDDLDRSEQELLDRKLAELKNSGTDIVTYYLVELGKVEIPGFDEELIISAASCIDRPKDRKPQGSTANQKQTKRSWFGGRVARGGANA